MITLESVKTYLNIDFADNDALLQNYVDMVKHRASTATGISQTVIAIDPITLVETTVPNPDFDTPELDGAMLEDVAHMYANRGESVTGSDTAFATYRRLSKRPMF